MSESNGRTADPGRAIVLVKVREVIDYEIEFDTLAQRPLTDLHLRVENPLWDRVVDEAGPNEVINRRRNVTVLGVDLLSQTPPVGSEKSE